MGEPASTNRDIKGHLLFEIATEVANRGMSPDLLCDRAGLTAVQWEASTP
jgi:hypothetical protein